MQKVDTVANTDEQQVVILELARESYGVEIARVQEIIRMQPITRVPNGPPCIEGVTNLRGRIIPVLDLRKRLGFEATALARQGRIVVAELGEHIVGMVVDGVSEVFMISPDAIEPPSMLVTTTDSRYLRGVAKIGDRLILLLDLALILTGADDVDLTRNGAEHEAPASQTLDGRRN